MNSAMHPSRQSSKVERVLVCVLAKTRAHELCFTSFKRCVLDELNADLAVALTIDHDYDYANPFWQHAKYRWTAPDFADYGQRFDLAQRLTCAERDTAPADWRALLAVKGAWQGRIHSPDPQPSPSYSPQSPIISGGHWTTPVGSSEGHISRADLRRTL